MRPPETPGPREDDREIARRFKDLREQELASVPGFRPLLARAARTPARPRLRLRGAAVGLALAVVLAAALLLARRAPKGLDPNAPSALSHWKASTDVLLETSGRRLWESSPRVPEPVPDYSALTDPVQRQETQPTRSPKGV